MVTVKTGASSQDVLQGAKHVLFVEGTKDVAVLEKLLSPKLRVEPLGPSFSVRSVAKALRKFHPEYWFIIAGFRISCGQLRAEGIGRGHRNETGSRAGSVLGCGTRTLAS